MSKLVAIRLPDDLYDAIATIGKEKFPKKPNKKTDNDFDISAIIVHLLREKLDLPDNVSPSVIQDVKQSFDDKLTELRSELTRVETEGYMTAKNLEKSEQKISELETKFSSLREALDDQTIITKLADLIKRIESLESAINPQKETIDNSESAIAAEASEVEQKILDSIEAINSINEQSIASKKKEKLPTKKEIFAKEVLSLLEQGLSYQKIADQIGISKSLVSQIVTEKKKT